MKILEMTGEPILHGGQERFLSNLISNIDITGLQIDVLTPYKCDNRAFKELVISKGGRIYELSLPFHPGKSRKLLLDPLTKFLKGKGYDVIHIHSGSISVLAYSAFAARLARIKKIIVHSHSTGVSSLKHSVIRIVFGFLMKPCVTNYLACSEDAGIMKYSKAVVRKELMVVRNGIPINDYCRNNDKRIMIRNSLNIPEESYIIGHVGRFSEEKNHKFLINIFSKIVNMLPQSRLLLVGNGELLNEIKKEVANKKLSESVIFTGNVDNVQDYYQAMDCFVLPSIYEGFSLVTLEAQAAGLSCVISTGVPEDVMIGKNINRISLSCPQAWMDRIVANKDILPVDNSESIRVKGYDISNTADTIRKLYFEN